MTHCYRRVHTVLSAVKHEPYCLYFQPQSITALWPVLTSSPSDTDDTAANWRSRSLKVIDFCRNRKPVYDFLSVVNCHPRSNPRRFRDIASRIWKPPYPSLSPLNKGTHSNFVVTLKLYATFVRKPRDPIELQWSCHSILASQTTDRRQTVRQNIMVIATRCNKTFG